MDSEVEVDIYCSVLTHHRRPCCKAGRWCLGLLCGQLGRRCGLRLRLTDGCKPGWMCEVAARSENSGCSRHRRRSHSSDLMPPTQQPGHRQSLWAISAAEGLGRGQLILRNYEGPGLDQVEHLKAMYSLVLTRGCAGWRCRRACWIAPRQSWPPSPRSPSPGPRWRGCSSPP